MGHMTPRHHRNLTEQVRDSLKTLLSSLEHHLQVQRGEYGQLEDKANRVRKALAEIEALLSPPVLGTPADAASEIDLQLFPNRTGSTITLTRQPDVPSSHVLGPKE